MTGSEALTALSLVGIADDGAHLLVERDDGAQFALPVTDELRRAVRHASSVAAAAAPSQPPSGSSLSPREIQQRLRAGLTPAELAEISGEPLEAIEKFAAPVLSERQYVIDQARATRIGRDSGAPLLDDLVQDRLAARGVRPEGISWDAWRAVDEPWRVCVDFTADGRSSRAAWTYDHTARSLTAEDEESRWLTETELIDAPIPRRHLSAVRAEAEVAAISRPAAPAGSDRVVSDGGPPSAAIPMPEPSTLSPTEALLEDLDGRRGTRESVAPEDGEDEDGEVFEGFGPARSARTAEVGFGHPVGGAMGDDAPEPKPVAAPGSATPSPERKSKRGRASVPSWDEIVFGAKQSPSE
jgi:hypothetical protein